MSIRLAILVSGRGSNLEAILQAIKNGNLDAQVEVVISNRPEALSLTVARKFGVHALAIDHKGISREEHERRLLDELSLYPVDYVVLAGYMRVLSQRFLCQYQDPGGYYRVINIHPSLLPAFPGSAAYEEAFNSGVSMSGVTIHLVDEKVDHGPILAQESFPRLKEDTLETFRARGLSLEHKLFPKTLQHIAQKGLCITPKTEYHHNRNHVNRICSQQELSLAVVPRNGFQPSDKHIEFPLYWLLVEQMDNSAPISVQLLKLLSELLVDPLTEELWHCYPYDRVNWMTTWLESGFDYWAERQFLPGVTDNLARTVEEAIRSADIDTNVRVASGNGFLFKQSSKLNSSAKIKNFCSYKHFHPLTDSFVVHNLKDRKNFENNLLQFPMIKLPSAPPIEIIDLELSDDELERLSKDRVLALSILEMKAIRKHFEQTSTSKLRAEHNLPKWPTDVELEIIAQTWSEHCKHKIFNATIEQTDFSKAKPLQQTTITSLYKTFIKAATQKLSAQRTDLLSVFEDNAGVFKFNTDWGICFKVETHNSPSALEPYGGALTGILGVNRDILGTGLGAKPILNTDVFCFAYPSRDLCQRPTMLPAEAIIRGVRKGVQDGGNKSGIPTVNGAVYFDPGYRAKPLVFCGTAGLLPLTVRNTVAYKKHTIASDTIVMAGGKVGKDGIHGATFSSEALHEGSPVSAVQIGDPFTQKRLLDFVIEARDAGLISGITDNGAGGLSSSVGEMAQLTGGATLELDNIPLKYPGLADWEIVVSESQERMTLSTRDPDKLKDLASKHGVEITVIGTFHNQGYFEITRHGKPVAMLDLHFLHEGVPNLHLYASWSPPTHTNVVGAQPGNLDDCLLKLLAHPNISSRESLVRQYDHEVQGTSVVKPLMGPRQLAPSDAAVIKPLFDDPQGLVVANGLCPALSSYDCYLMAQCAVDEAIRNAVAVGADPSTLCLLDNFCWPDPVESIRNADGKIKLAQLVRACEGLFDAALAYVTPFISGKDSMKNDFDDGVVRLSIPPTLLVSAIGKLPDSSKAITSEFKSPGDLIFLLSAGKIGLAGSQYLLLNGWSSSYLPSLNMVKAARMYKKLHGAMKKGWIASCHDLSEGGLGVALAECIIGSQLGASILVEKVLEAANFSADLLSDTEEESDIGKRLDIALFGEGPACLVVTVPPAHQSDWIELWNDEDGLTYLGQVIKSDVFQLEQNDKSLLVQIDRKTLTKAWQAPLPFDEEAERL